MHFGYYGRSWKKKKATSWLWHQHVGPGCNTYYVLEPFWVWWLFFQAITRDCNGYTSSHNLDDKLFYWHEKHRLLPCYGRKIPFMLQVSDDIFRITLIGGGDGFSPNEWKEFEADIDNFGIPWWEVDEPSSRVDFLKITMKIKDGTIIPKTYQKPINPYQYITPNSAHPLWMLKGIVFSTYVE